MFLFVCLLSLALLLLSNQLTNAKHFKNTHTTRQVKHAKLAEATEEAVTDPSKVNVKLKPENVDIAYPPIFQSGTALCVCVVRACCASRAFH